jgi:hypothetical protein
MPFIDEELGCHFAEPICRSRDEDMRHTHFPQAKSTPVRAQTFKPGSMRWKAQPAKRTRNAKIKSWAERQVGNSVLVELPYPKLLVSNEPPEAHIDVRSVVLPRVATRIVQAVQVLVLALCELKLKQMRYLLEFLTMPRP